MRKVALAVIAGLIVAVLSVALTRGDVRDEQARPAAAALPPEPTRGAAVVSATAFLEALDLRALLDDGRRAEVIEEAAHPDAKAKLRRLYEAEKERVARSYRKPPRFARAALAGYRVSAFSSREATVLIWAASIGGSGSYPPAAGWSTTAITMRWLEDRWLVADVRHEPGPAPDWPIETLAADGSRFKAYRHAP